MFRKATHDREGSHDRECSHSAPDKCFLGPEIIMNLGKEENRG